MCGKSEIKGFKKYFQVQTLNEQEWEKMEQAQVLASVQHAFDASDTECSQTDDNESIFESMDMLSPSAHTEAQTLAFMLQEQLDAINNEIRLVHSFFFLFFHLESVILHKKLGYKLLSRFSVEICIMLCN